MAQQKILCIVGPTSSGKSALAVELARKFNGEIISADSRQVYKGLDVGTGKITKREMRGIRHHLLDVASPQKRFTAHDFVVRARKAIADMAGRGKLPIVCGGTGFYIDALLGRITLPDVPANSKLRAQFEKKTAAQLFALLKQRDPHRAKSIDPRNKRRLIRALEVAAAGGPAPNVRGFVNPYIPLWVGLQLPPERLKQRIAIRLFARLRRGFVGQARIREGMVVEAQRLHARGLSYKRMRELGLEYRSLARFLQGKLSRAELERELQNAIWQYARRQMTYWRRNKEIRWFKPKDKKLTVTVQRWLSS